MRLTLLVTLLFGLFALADEGSWSVTLTDTGDQKIQVIKIVRDATALGLKDAKDLVEAPKPKLVRENLSKADADALVAALVAKGAKAEAHPHGAHGPARAPRAPTKEAVAGALFEVRLEHLGPNKLQVIKIVREFTGLGLADTKKLVESAPVVLKELVEHDTALKMSTQLTEVGAKVKLTPQQR